jgi:hypothetical protein
VSSIDEFFDDTPNYEREQGLTFPRLLSLIDAYNERHRRELAEHANATALAHHDPKQLKRAFEAPSRPSDVDESDSEFESEWWRR